MPGRLRAKAARLTELAAALGAGRDHRFALAIFFGGLFLGWVASTFSAGRNPR